MRFLFMLGFLGLVGMYSSVTLLAAVAPAATAVVYPLGETEVFGLVKMVQEEDGIHITGEISGLTPGGYHGFHLHEFGDCSSPDGMGVGGHFNPEGHVHGGPTNAARHFGDFGNIQADEEGVARIDLRIEGAQGLEMVFGRGLIVHAGQDDEKSNPAGNAGPRIACGVVGITNPGL